MIFLIVFSLLTIFSLYGFAFCLVIDASLDNELDNHNIYNCNRCGTKVGCDTYRSGICSSCPDRVY